MEENNQQKISMIRYVLTNPKFSSFDKAQFFGFFFTSFVFLFLIVFVLYKAWQEDYDISYLEVLIFFSIFIPFIKYTQYFAKKFTIPYKNFIGEGQKGEKLEAEFDKGIKYIQDSQRIGFKYYLLFVIPLAIFGLFALIIANKFYAGVLDFSSTTKSYHSFRSQLLLGGIIALAISFIIWIFWNKKEQEIAKKDFPGYGKWLKWINIVIIGVVLFIIFWIFFKIYSVYSI